MTARAIEDLVAHLELVARTGQARNHVQRWADTNPTLSGYRSAVEASAAIRAGRPSAQDALVEALLHVAEEDHLAQLTVVAGLSRRLGWVVARWARAGLPESDVAVLEADLVSECWAAVALTAASCAQGRPVPPRPAMALVQLAWQRVRGARRRQVLRDARQVPIGENLSWPDVPETGRADVELAGEIVAAYRAGRLTLTAARLIFATRVAGLAPAEAAQLLGCSPQSVRTRRSRAERRLVAVV